MDTKNKKVNKELYDNSRKISLYIEKGEAMSTGKTDTQLPLALLPRSHCQKEFHKEPVLGPILFNIFINYFLLCYTALLGLQLC